MKKRSLKRLIGILGYLASTIVYLVIKLQNIDKTELRLFVDNWQIFIPLLIVTMISAYMIYDK